MPVLGTLGFDRVGNCVVYVGCDAAPVNEDWDQYTAFLTSLRSRSALDRALVFPGTGIPSPSQRRQLQQVTKNVEIRVAVVTASLAVRAVVTGLSWFAPGYKSFSPGEVRAALGFLDYSGKQAESVLDMARALGRDLGVPIAAAFG